LAASVTGLTKWPRSGDRSADIGLFLADTSAR